MIFAIHQEGHQAFRGSAHGLRLRGQPAHGFAGLPGRLAPGADNNGAADVIWPHQAAQLADATTDSEPGQAHAGIGSPDPHWLDVIKARRSRESVAVEHCLSDD